MARRSKKSSEEKPLPDVRVLRKPDKKTLLNIGVDPHSVDILLAKTVQRFLLLTGVRPYMANILKQTMLSIGGDVAVHRDVISGKIERSNCLIIGDLRHYRRLLEKLNHQPGFRQLCSIMEEKAFKDEDGLVLDLCGKRFGWDVKPVIMGILNVTDDSFSDGGLWNDTEKAYRHAMEMLEQGAEIIDVGGESTRPGSQAIGEEEELKRVIPVIEKIASSTSTPISIDTQKSGVASRAIDSGASIVNDVSALRSDSDMLNVIREKKAGAILMHMRGTPADMQKNTHYSDTIGEIYAFLKQRVELCMNAGILKTSILIDPGIGFGKDVNGNLEIIKHISEFRGLGMPVVLGYSRKSFIGDVLDTPVTDREHGTDAMTAWSTIEGVHIVRVHNVRNAVRIRDMLRSVMGSQ